MHMKCLKLFFCVSLILLYQNCSSSGLVVTTLNPLSSSSQMGSTSPALTSNTDYHFQKQGSLSFGYNYHGIIPDSYYSVINGLKQNNSLGMIRLGLNYDADPTQLKQQIIKLNSMGIKTQLVLMTSFQYTNSTARDKTGHPTSTNISDCSTDLTLVQTMAYNETTNMVNSVKDVVVDFELQNETSLRQELRAEVETNTTDDETSYLNKTCYATRTAVLKGMSQAINNIRVSSGLKLRIILGTVGRDFAFLRYMASQGVLYDVVGYHIYPYSTQKSLASDPWFWNTSMLEQLSRFKKPITINEFNCSEIYSKTYDSNPADLVLTEKCNASLFTHLTTLVNQKIAPIESLLFYELLDEPTKTGVAEYEKHFGLFTDILNPKFHFQVISIFTGGNVTQDNFVQLKNRGFTSL